MKFIQFVQTDGGRSKYYRASSVGDCVTRAAALATGRDYKEVYDLIRRVTGESPRDGLTKEASRKAMEALGGVWHPTMTIGSGCTVHLRADELPKGRLVVALSGHLAAVVDGVLYDNHDCSRLGTRCVYGYWKF